MGKAEEYKARYDAAVEKFFAERGDLTRFSPKDAYKAALVRASVDGMYKDADWEAISNISLLPEIRADQAISQGYMEYPEARMEYPQEVLDEQAAWDEAWREAWAETYGDRSHLSVAREKSSLRAKVSRAQLSGDEEAIREAKTAYEEHGRAYREAVVRAVANGLPVKRAAEAAGVGRPTVYRWMDEAGADGCRGGEE